MKIKIEKKYIKFPISAYAVTKKLCFYKEDGTLVFDLDCKLDFTAPTFTAYVDMSRFHGMELEYSSIPEISFSLEQCDEREYDNLYHEEFRPFVHFTPKSGWHNDPNGMIKYGDQYHMFFQYNPCGTEWGNMHWGHSVSKDLLHWDEKDIVLTPDEMGTMYSGSAIEDTVNVTNLKSGEYNPLLLYYTAAGNKSLLSKDKLRTQCLAYSCDGGKTFTKYKNNPVINHIESYNRDPKVIFVPELNKYLIVLYLADDRYGLLTSENLIDWEKLQEIVLRNDSECPDIYNFEIGGNSYWAIIGASDKYIIGTFEKGRFVQKSSEKSMSYTKYSYAAQSFSGIDDGRKIRVAWDKLNIPSPRITHQMGFPTEIRLVKHNNDFYLCSSPVDEIKYLYCDTITKKDFVIDEAGIEINLDRAAYDIIFVAEFKNKMTLNIFGLKLDIIPLENSIVWDKSRIPISLDLDLIKLRMIVDRCSVEIFSDDGKFCATIPFLCDYNISKLTVSSADLTQVKELTCNRLKSIH